MAYRRQPSARRGSYSSSGSRGYSSRGPVGRRPASRARRGSGRASPQRQQVVKIVLQTTQAPAISSPFGQQVESKPQRSKL